MELEETLMQWKQKTHLLQILEVDNFFFPVRSFVFVIKLSNILQPHELEAAKNKLENLTPFEKLILNVEDEY